MEFINPYSKVCWTFFVHTTLYNITYIHNIHASVLTKFFYYCDSSTLSRIDWFNYSHHYLVGTAEIFKLLYWHIAFMLFVDFERFLKDMFMCLLNVFFSVVSSAILIRCRVFYRYGFFTWQVCTNVTEAETMYVFSWH